MPEDICKKERQELDDALFKLKMQRANPMGWDTTSREYQERLAELESEVAGCKKALKECQARSKKG